MKYKGEPLPSGRVSFVCEGGDKPVIRGDITGGKYTLANVPAGPATITVETIAPVKGALDPSGKIPEFKFCAARVEPADRA